MTPLEEYKEALEKFKKLVKARDYKVSNEYRHTVTALFNKLDNPFKSGDYVEYFTGKKWMPTRIVKVVSNSEVESTNLIAPFNIYRFENQKEVKKIEVEQMTLEL